MFVQDHVLVPNANDQSTIFIIIDSNKLVFAFKQQKLVFLFDAED
jgi:hypothetical protein